MPATVINPLVYLPFHLAGHHLVARNLPAKSITYPMHFVFAMFQYLVEHYSAEFPTVASLGGLLVAIALSTAPYVWYRAYQNTEGPKSLVLASIVGFFAILFVSKGFELGFPKDDPVEQAAANRDSAHSWYHLALHVFLLLDQLATNYHVPWNPKANDSTMPVVPASPKHNTLKPTRLVEETCSPQKKKGALKSAWTAWPKAKAI